MTLADTREHRILRHVCDTKEVLPARLTRRPGSDPLIADNSFRTIPVLPEALVAGAVIEIDQLCGKASTALILQNEQIPMERLTEACPRKEPATPIVCVLGSP